MNIMLTDISSLSLDQQELPLATRDDADSFAGLFSQQFPVEPGKEAQGIDNKAFSAEILTLAEAAELVPELSPGSNGDENPLPLAAAIPINPNPSRVTPQLLAGVEMQPLKPGPGVLTGAPPVGSTGEVLPAGGKSLPLNVTPDMAQRGMLVTAPVASVADAIKAAISEPGHRVAAPSVAPQPGKSEPLPVTISAAAEKVTPAADFVSVMNKSAVAEESAQPVAIRKAITSESGQLVARDLLADARPGSETRQPGLDEVMRNVDFRTAAPLPRSEGLAGQTPQPGVAALTMVGEDQLDESQRVLKGLRESATAETVAVRETAMDRNLTAAEKTPLAGTTAVRDMPGSAEYRNPDMLAQPPVNQQQPAVAPSASALHSVAVPPQALTPGTPSSALPPHLETLTMPRNADSTAWGSGLSERVNWMINQKQNTATIRLDPPFLGKLDVHIKIADDVTTVSFLTQHAQARDLIESASVRLRDFLQESGYQNVNVDVSQRQDQQQARSNSAFDAEAEQQDEAGHEQALEQRERDQARYFIGEGIVDTFA